MACKSVEIIVLGMADLSRPDRATPVRIQSLYSALKALSPTTLIAGNRTPRRRALVRFLIRGGLRRTRAVYVESSTSTATETDLLFLNLVRRAGIPLIVYIRDAYQLFPELYPRRGMKVKMLDWGWRRSISTYQQLADLLLYPSWGLAACFENRAPVALLPPAGLPARGCSPLSWEPPTIIYVGAASHNDGSDLLLDAMQQVVEMLPAARCRFVTSNTDAEILTRHPAHQMAWLDCESRTFEELPALMRSATAAVIPRRRNPYNDLAMPVKQFDYMSFGLPLVVTACRDMARLIAEHEAGLVVDDNADSLAQGIMRLLDDRELAGHLGRNGYKAVQTAHSWDHRAARIVGLIEQIEEQKRHAHSPRK